VLCAHITVQAVSLFDYVAQKDDELSFEKDCVINVLEKSNADWWRGEYDDFTGVFPSNYVKLIGQTESKKPVTISQPARETVLLFANYLMNLIIVIVSN
jgi:hypothetical protein